MLQDMVIFQYFLNKVVKYENTLLPGLEQTQTYGRYGKTILRSCTDALPSHTSNINMDSIIAGSMNY